MDKAKSTVRVRNATTYALFAILLTGCSPTTGLYFTDSSMKMTHHTTILSPQTHRLVDATLESQSSVNFEYEEIITQ